MPVALPDLSSRKGTGLSIESGPVLQAMTVGWSAWSNATALLFVGWVLIAFLALQARPGAEVVAVVFSPLWNSQQIFSALASSDASIVRTTALTAVVVVRPHDHDGATRLHRAGAWLIIDPQAVAACMANIAGK